MGAWGPGMQANDEALDVIHHYRHRLEGIDRTKKARVRKIKAERLFVDMEKAKASNEGMLGVADWLLDKRVDLKDVEVLDKVLKEELKKDRLDCWTTPKDRVEALENFKKRRAGKKVDVSLDNAGLFTRMGASNAELKGRIKQHR